MRIGFTLVLIFAFVSSIQAQNIEFKSSNFKDKKEELKQAVADLEAGNEFLDQANEKSKVFVDAGDLYLQALSKFMKAQQFNPENAELNFKIGNCYLYTHEKDKAFTFLEKGVKLDPEVSDMKDFYLGMAYQIQGDYKQAVKSLSAFKTSKSYEEYKKICTELIHASNAAPEMISNHVRAWVDNLEHLNSPQDDFGPSVSADGEALLFTSNRENGRTKNEFGHSDDDIYSAHWDGKKWGSAKPIGGKMNSEFNDIMGNLGYDGQRLVMSRDEAGNADIFESKLEGNDWGEPQLKMSRLLNTESNEYLAAYEPLDIKLYFVYDGGSGGDKDVFFSGLMVQHDNIWGKATSAGHQVNTRFHEGSVFVHPDGKTMYFSSQGHNSLGGYDIYKAEFVEGQWTNIQNLGYPINSSYDDLFYAETANGKYAYIASNRPGGKGGLDLYQVTYWGPEKPVAVNTEDMLLASLANPIKDLSIAAPKKVEKKSLTVFKGKVVDAIAGNPLQADLEIMDNQKAEIISKFQSNSATGKFLLSLPAGKNYGISVRKDGYLFHSENFNLPKGGDFNMVNKTVELKNIAVGSKIALRNVFFATGKADVTPESFPELDRLVSLMNDVPGLKIELSGHTDNVGSENLNQKLSQDRADAVVAVLAKKGVGKDRMTSKGYGSAEPVDSNGSSEGRQNNRRTEFKITAN